jgi:hypothetical protein
MALGLACLIEAIAGKEAAAPRELGWIASLVRSSELLLRTLSGGLPFGPVSFPAWFEPLKIPSCPFTIPQMLYLLVSHCDTYRQPRVLD